MGYNKVPHLIEVQYEAEQEFLKQFNQGEYTLENPLVVLNPYKICPLSALVMFRTEEECRPCLKVKGKYAGTDLTHQFGAAREHILPVYGLYADYKNTVTITLDNGECADVTIETAPYKFHEAARALLSRCEEGYLDNELIFMMGQLNSRNVAYDRMGEIRWYTTEPFAFASKRLRNGNLLTGSFRFMSNPYMTTGVMEMSLTGKILKEYRIPGGYHHDQCELPNGDLLIGTQVLETATKEDVVVWVDRKSGEVKKVFDLKDYLPVKEGRSGHSSDYDWFHNNSVCYDPASDSIILSGRHQSAIISIGLHDNKLHWILGSPEGWSKEIVDRYLFTPVGDTEHFEWPSEQHSAVLTDDGDIMCFDNGDYRSKDPAHFLKHRDSYSRGVRYHIDTDKMEIEQVWQYGKERGPEFYSGYIGGVEYYGPDHYMIHSGGIAFLNGEVSELLGSRLGRGPMKDKATLTSVTVIVKDGKVVYECLVPANMYRALKLHPYNEEEYLPLGKGEILGSLGVSAESALPENMPALETAVAVPEEMELYVGDDTDRYDVYGRFAEGDAVSFIFCKDGKAQCYGLKTKVPPLTMKEMPAEKQDGKRWFWRYIHKEGCDGGKLYVYVNGSLYDSGITL